MNKINYNKILDIVGGQWMQGNKNGFIDGIFIDSRKSVENSLFIPIIGANNDGHDYLAEVFKKGGQIALSQDKNRDFPKGMAIIAVESTFASLQALANYNRHQSKAAVVAITGSSGKTTTKDLVASVLSQKYNTLKTQGNFNSEFGIPQTLLRLNENHQMAVIEMGMDQLGDIAKSIDLVDPELALITNIGLSHIEILKNQENIYKAKKEILAGLKKDDIALINSDDPYLSRLVDENNGFMVKTVGLSERADLSVSSYQSSARGLSMVIKGESYSFSLPGQHNLYNCLMAIWVGKNYGLSQEEIQAGLTAFKPSKNRMAIFECEGMKFIDDSYNANPDAMRGALDVLATLGKEDQGKGATRRIAILGDMLEMGDYASLAHYEIGLYARDKVDVLITVGDVSGKINDGFKRTKNNLHVIDVEQAIISLDQIKQAGDVILVKGSRGIGLDQLIAGLKER